MKRFEVEDASTRIGQFLNAILDNPKFEQQIADYRWLDDAPAEFGVNRLPWPAAIASLLQRRNLHLYSHQTLATDHIRAGHSIVISTPTASGKSLVYNLPILENHLRQPDATALYIFPLKALAQNQLAALNRLAADWPEEARPVAAIYDGDTSDYARRKIRANPPHALITNPEMLHLGILPYHQNWTTFLANLTHIVVDEAHIYRGVFGSHMAQVFRRLNRIASRYGANPTYVFCTATLGNPAELAAKLAGQGQEPVLISKSGAPQGKRHFLFLNPELASSTCAIDILKQALGHGLRTIVYCHSRRMTELISVWAGSEAGPWAGKIASYRAGYLPGERREIEAAMASGKLMAVISTSALELGIDIGGLDVCILVGYPGTITQTLQRGGRVGRAGQESAVVLVAGEDALDQYLARHPAELFSRRPEKAAINPDNSLIMRRHLECAAVEQPLSTTEPLMQEPLARRLAEEMARDGVLGLTADGSQWIARRKRPHRDVNLRGGGQTYSMEDDAGNIIGMMDNLRAWKEAHPGAIYMHRGQTFLSREIDCGSMRILMEPVRAGWFTRARSKKETVILEEYGRKDLGSVAMFYGRLRISEQVTGFERRAVSGNTLMNVTPLDAPAQIFETEGLWYVIPDEARRFLEERFLHFMGSIHAMEHAAIGMLPLEVMADRNDFGGISIPLHPQLGFPAVFIYDGLEGGAGLCREAFAGGDAILKTTLQAVRDCSCEDGCPSCIQSPKCGAGNRPLSKSGCVALLGQLLKGGQEGSRIAANLRISPPPDVFTLDFPASAPTRTFQPDPLCSVTAHVPTGRYVVFDVETRLSAREVGGWDNADKMGVSVAVLYDSRDDAFFSYEQDNLAEMFARMAEAEKVIGFNSIRFDYRVLQPFAPQCQEGPLLLHRLPTLDILQKVYENLHYRISLDNLSNATFARGKQGDGLQALAWWKEGKIAEIAAYCQKDVELTRDLYLFGLKERYLLFTNKAGVKTRIPVDFGG